MKEFATMGQLAKQFKFLATKGIAVEEHIVKAGGQIVKDDAGVRIGMYQKASGPFNAWKELADSTVRDRVNKGFTPFEPLFRTGALRESIEVSVHGNKAVVGSSMDIALWQEQGTSRIPPRPFLGPALFDAKLPIGRVAATSLVAWVAGLDWRRPPQSIKLP